VKVGRLAAAAAVLLAAHAAWSYLPREREVVPRLGAGLESGGRGRAPATGERSPVAGDQAGGEASEPLQVLAAGAYDACLWVPYPHQNLGVLAGAVGDLQAVIAAASRLEAGESSTRKAGEAEEAPSFGPFEVPPASELVACSDLAGGRLRLVARIYPALSVVAKLAGRLAGNPWLAGGTAGRMRIAWEGRLWSVTGGAAGPPGTLPRPAAPVTASAASVAPEARPPLPPVLAVLHWTGARPEIPAGFYALTRRGQDLVVSTIGSGGGSRGVAGAVPDLAAAAAAAGPPPVMLVGVGAEWPAAGAPPATAVPPAAGEPAAPAPRQAAPLAASSSSSPPFPPVPLPPAALALFEAGGSRVTSLGALPGLAVFNAAGAATERWRLPAEGIFRLLAGRLPAAELAGWRIVALDKGSLRQAQGLAPRLAAWFAPGAAVSGAAVPGAAVPSGAAPGGGAGAAAGAPGGTRLSLGVWLEPRAALRVVSRIRRFVEGFPLASQRQVDLWRDWETVLDPLANCRHTTLTATAGPPAMQLVLRGCAAATGPR
jgi:hypothetical protein